MIPYYIYETIPIGPLAIHVWGLLVGVGFVIGGYVAYRAAERYTINPNYILDVVLISLIASFVGGRLGYVMFNWSLYSSVPLDAFKVWEGGMALYGGVVAAVLANIWYCRWRKIDFFRLADCTVPGLALGLAVGRLGCFAIHDHLGKIMDHIWPWGIVYQDTVRHEPSLYEIVSMTALFLVLWALRARISRSGVLASIALGWYAISRFVIDFFRATDIYSADPRYAGLTANQYISILLLVIAVAVYVRGRQTEAIHHA